MVEDVKYKFDPEIFDKELRDLIEAWKSTWLSPTSGPLILPKRLNHLIPEEDYKNEEPTQIAYQKILDYVLISAKIARRTGEIDELLDYLDRNVNSSLAGGQVGLKKNLYKDLLAHILKNYEGKEEYEDNTISAIIQSGREQFGNHLTNFGFWYQ